MKQLTTILFVFAFAFTLFAQDLPTTSGKSSQNFNSNNPRVVLYSQLANPSTDGVYAAQDFEAGFDTYDCFWADDFTATAMWSINSMEVYGAYWNGTGPCVGANVWFYTKDATQFPATQIAERLNCSIVNTNGNLVITLPTPVVLDPGNYWVSMNGKMDFAVGGQWGYQPHMGPIGTVSCWRNPGGGFGQGTTWLAINVFQPATIGTEVCFSLSGDIVPVELTSFTASATGTSVTLNWSTATETNNKGFEVQKMVNGSFEAISFINGYGTTTETQNYSFIDKNLVSGTYTYRLKQIDFDGSFSYLNEVSAEISIPDVYSLSQNYPNPFNPSTKIAFTLPVDSKVMVRVYDVLGSEVSVLANGFYTAGNHELNLSAQNLMSGIYFYSLEAAGIDGSTYSMTKKMSLLK